MGRGHRKNKQRRGQTASPSSNESPRPISSAGVNNQIINLSAFKKQFPKLADNFHHYPKILALNKVPTALSGRLEITEKIHGSNFRLMITPNGYVLGSRRMLVNTETQSTQFRIATEYVQKSQWLAEVREQYPPGTVLYGELYGRGLSRGMSYASQELDIRLFNLRLNDGQWISAHDTDIDSTHLVPLLAVKTNPSLAELEELMQGSSLSPTTDSQKEGLVLKNYQSVDKNGGPVWVKMVRDQFREDLDKRKEFSETELAARKHSQVLAKDLAGSARCQKALERASEGRDLQGNMEDMPLLVKALRTDLSEECHQEIKEAVAAGMDEDFFWKSSTRNLAQWYQHLLKETGHISKQSGSQSAEPSALPQAALEAKKYVAERFSSLVDEVDLICIQHPGKRTLQVQSVNQLPEIERQAGLLILDGRINEAEKALEKAALQQDL